ncbi:MAG: hypothetical protein ABL983_00975 [Nitrospira sp.]
MNIRNVYPKRVGPTPLSASATSVFTADKRYGIEQFIFSNISTTNQTVSAYIVTSGGSASTSNAFLTDVTIPSNDVMPIKFPTILNVNDSIYALASASVNMTFNVNDVEIGAQ